MLRTLAAFDALVERERPRRASRYVDGRHPGVIAQAAAARRSRYSGPGWPDPRAVGACCGWTRAHEALAAGSRLSRLRARAGAARARARVAAFVHTAFWRSATAPDGSAESYIGPVLRALETRVPPAGIRYVGVGPRTNFRARRWWDPVRRARRHGRRADRALRAGGGAGGVARDLSRSARARRSLWDSAELRAHAVIRGCDCWPLVRQQLAGIALLQWPWSARAMDEAAAALDALAPEVVVTYAEAGRLGPRARARSRRRGIPSPACSTASSTATG